MSQKNIKIPEIINSIIGEGSAFKGEINLFGDLRLDGTLYGKVYTHGRVVIGESGILWGDLLANEAIISGEIHGNIVCYKRITVLSSGKILGNIASASLVFEKGTYFNGYCKVNPEIFSTGKYNEQYITNIFQELSNESPNQQPKVFPLKNNFPNSDAPVESALIPKSQDA